MLVNKMSYLSYPTFCLQSLLLQRTVDLTLVSDVLSCLFTDSRAVKLGLYKSTLNKCGAFMDAMSKPPPQHFTGRSFHRGGKICDVLGDGRYAAKATDERTNEQTDRQNRWIVSLCKVPA